MSGDEKDKNLILISLSEFDMTVRVFKGGSFDREHEIDQMENVLENLYDELHNDVGEFAFFIDIQVNGCKLDGLLVIDHPEEEKRNVVVIIELKNISGDLLGDLDLENEEWKEKTEDGDWETLRYEDGKKIKPLTQCKRYSKEVAKLSTQLFESEDHKESIKFWKLFPLLRSITVLPDDAKFHLENYTHNIEKWFNVINEKDIAKGITKLRKGCDLSIPFEEMIKLLKKHATKPDSKQQIKELKTEKEINQFWRDLRETEDIPERTTEPKISYPQIQKALRSDNKQDIKYAFEVIDFLGLKGHKDEILSLINHKDPEIRKITLENIDKWLEGKELTEEILKYVDDECIGVWRKADELMVAYGTRSARSKYNDIIKRSNYFDRVYSALDVLKSVGNDDTIDLLIDLYNDSKSRFEEQIKREKRWEISIDEEITEDERKDQIENETDSELKKMERQILDTIKEIGGPKVIPLANRILDQNMEEYENCLRSRKSSSDFNQKEFEHLQSLESEITESIELLGQSRDQNAVSILSNIINNEKCDSSLKTKAIDALSELEFNALGEILIEILHDKNYDCLLRLEAIGALGELGFEENIECLHRLIEEDNPIKYLEMKDASESELETKVISALGKIGSKKSFDVLYEKYGLINNNEVTKILVEIDRGKFEEKLFEKLRCDDWEEKSDHIEFFGSRITGQKIYRVSEKRLDELMDILHRYVEKTVLLEDEIIDQIYDVLQEKGNSEEIEERVDKIVRDANIISPDYEDEKIDEIKWLLKSEFSLSVKNILTDTLSQIIRRDGELPNKYVGRIKGYVNSSKPNLRILGLTLIDELSANVEYDDFRMEKYIGVDDILHLKGDDKIITVLEQLQEKVYEEDILEFYLDEYDIPNTLIQCLGSIGSEKAVKHLFDYLGKDDVFHKKDRLHPAFVQLEHIMNSEDEIGKNYGGKNDILIPKWILNKVEESQRYCKFIAYYWQNEAIELFNDYIEDCDNRLKLHVCHSLSNLEFEVVKPLFKKLTLDRDPRVREVAVRTYNNITGKNLYMNDVIRKAEIDEL